ncbi:amidohydrolase family protein [Ulvibacter sp. MAR_2010_11]|uniref:amidohydrolase family protein n=1 Tax=Ulvibacter sp. MAR_2010_11 TaxID=1250229 RepID=UPI000C2C33E9|nr:amidohydrolase family protein [Ulvibacter sp. MAR_2010_11]PKA82007.1 amidohydrolase family protein [Ulvibacter sp. MAR_2010_11]
MKNIKNIIFILALLTIGNRTLSQTNSNNGIALTNVTIIDVENSLQMEEMTIIIEGEKIKSIQPSDSTSLKNIGQIIDLKGNYVIPGLIDSHVHLFRPKNRIEILTALLYSGITTVRDMGGDARMYQSLMKEIENGTLDGPDIYYSANFFGPTFLEDPRTKFAASGYQPGEAPWMRMITEETNLQQVVSEVKEVGATGIKVYSNITPPLLNKISNEAHTQGLQMWSHSSVFPSKPSDAVTAGVDVLSHGVGMIFETQSNLPISFNDAIKNHIKLQDFKNTDATAPEFLSLFKTMKLNETIFEPTLSSWKPIIRAQEQKNAVVEQVNPTAHLKAAAKTIDPLAMDDWAKRITKAAYQNGVTIAAGTDFNTTIKWVQDEIIFLTECGLSNLDALKAATLNNARAIGIEDTHGSISINKKANLVILSQNPLEDIKNIRTVISVYKNGKKYLKKE